jgi:hypothetical protein
VGHDGTLGPFSISPWSDTFRTAQAAPTPQAEPEVEGSAPLADPSSLRGLGSVCDAVPVTIAVSAGPTLAGQW